jgi:hypothetical protein
LEPQNFKVKLPNFLPQYKHNHLLHLQQIPVNMPEIVGATTLASQVKKRSGTDAGNQADGVLCECAKSESDSTCRSLWYTAQTYEEALMLNRLFLRGESCSKCSFA